MTATEVGSRYGSGILYDMTGPLAVGGEAYVGPFTIDEGWSPIGNLHADIAGSAGGHSLSGPCTPGPGAPSVAGNIFTCAVDLDGNQASVIFAFSAVMTSSNQTGPNEYTSDYVGTYTAQ
jgi:hypothetical protein